MPTIKLSSGEEIVIRRWELQDIPGLYRLMHAVFQEGKGMLTKVLPLTMEDLFREWHMQLPENQTTFVALAGEQKDQVVGWLRCERRSLPSLRHSATLWMGVAEAFRGKGIGAELIRESFNWAKEQGIERLELGVRGSNRSALALYKKMGFQEEGRKIRAIKTENGYEDDIWMCAYLGNEKAVEHIKAGVTAEKKKKLTPGLGKRTGRKHHPR